MMHFQEFASLLTRVPVFLSSLCILPAIKAAYGPSQQIAIFTANKAKLEPMRELIERTCAVQVGEERFVIVDCKDVPGFEAVERGEAVDTLKVEPGMVELAKRVVSKHPVVAILMECTELPPYSDAVRAATGLPVWDALSCCDFFVGSMKDNDRCGMADWQEEWDREQDWYKFGHELNTEERGRLESYFSQSSRLSIIEE